MLNKNDQTGTDFRMNDSVPHKKLGSLPHILVVDDDDRIRELVARYLSENDFFVSTAEDANQAKEILAVAEYDALVVDVMMPGQNGMEFTQELRETGKLQQDVPILLLTAMGEVEDKIKGLTAGADDYLTKPFDPRELVLRLQAILRRRPQPKEVNTNLRIGEWIFDVNHNELVDEENDKAVKLTDGEANLLKALGLQVGEVMSREALSEACGLDADKRTVDVQVTRLRRKLEKDSNNPRYLQTVRGKGYVLRAERL
jgi:two-component system phosphate regulon response regulator OmpR